MRAKVLKEEPGQCKVNADEFTCWSKVGSNPAKAYVSWDRLDKNYKDFCDNVDVPKNTVNWSFNKKYHEKTPEEHDFYIKLSNGASKFDKDQCRESFDRIINSCDGNDPNNPLNFKFGGRWVRGDYTFEINPKWDRALVTRMDGECNSHYKFWYSDYDISGIGWSTWDAGQQTILPAIKGCLGLGVTKWNFQYCQKREDCGGYDWTLHFRTPVFVKARCFSNLKVAKASGGYTHQYNQAYEKFGCAGSDK